MLETIKSYLKKNNYNYSISEEVDKNTIIFSYTIRNAVFAVFIEVFKEVNMFQLFIYAPNLVPDNKVCDVLKVLNYINQAKSLGNIVLLPDGYLRLQFSMLFGETIDEISLEFIFYSFEILAEFYPHILNVLVSNITGEEQI